MEDIHKQTSSTVLSVQKRTTTVLDKQYRLSNRDTKKQNKSIRLTSEIPVVQKYSSSSHIYGIISWCKLNPFTFTSDLDNTHTHKQLVAYHDALRGTGQQLNLCLTKTQHRLELMNIHNYRVGGRIVYKNRALFFPFLTSVSIREEEVRSERYHDVTILLEFNEMFAWKK